MDRLEASEAGQRRARLAMNPHRPPVCALCGFIPDKDGYYLRAGDDRELYDVQGELICSLCATPADLGSRQWRAAG